MFALSTYLGYACGVICKFTVLIIFSNYSEIDSSFFEFRFVLVVYFTWVGGFRNELLGTCLIIN